MLARKDVSSLDYPLEKGAFFTPSSLQTPQTGATLKKATLLTLLTLCWLHRKGHCVHPQEGVVGSGSRSSGSSCGAQAQAKAQAQAQAQA